MYATKQADGTKFFCGGLDDHDQSMMGNWRDKKNYNDPFCLEKSNIKYIDELSRPSSKAKQKRK